MCCGQSKHQFSHNARISNTMKSRMKFSSKFFLMRHTVLLYCVTGDRYLQLDNQMPFPLKCPGSKWTSWFMDKSSELFKLLFFKQVKSNIFQDLKTFFHLSLARLTSFFCYQAYQFRHLFITPPLQPIFHLSLFLFCLFLSSRSICVNSHICPLNLSGELLRNV